MTIKELDQKAVEISKRYKRCENLLLEVIIQIDQKKAFYKLGFNSLYAYVTEKLKLSPASAYNFINVARKSIEVPELKKEVLSGNISISKAQKMTSVLNKENQRHWLNLAKTETHRKLEREVSLASPKTAVREKAGYVSPELEIKEKVKILTKTPRIQLQIGVSEELMLKLRRAQDLESQKNKKNIDLENTLNAVLEIYLNKHDPVRKAKRQKIKGKVSENNNRASESVRLIAATKKSSSSSLRRVLDGGAALNQDLKKGRRKAIPAETVHRFQLRDRGQCSYVNSAGKRCTSSRFLEIHHIKPVSQGGSHALSNLQLLCSGHHKVCHQNLTMNKALIKHNKTLRAKSLRS